MATYLRNKLLEEKFDVRRIAVGEGAKLQSPTGLNSDVVGVDTIMPDRSAPDAAAQLGFCANYPERKPAKDTIEYQEEEERKTIAREFQEDIIQCIAMLNSELDYWNHHVPESVNELHGRTRQVRQRLSDFAKNLHARSPSFHSSKLASPSVPAAADSISGLSVPRETNVHIPSVGQEPKLNHKHPNVIGNSARIRVVLRQAEKVAATNSTVLILGETGTGKELVAQTIHELSGRKGRPMIKTNCAALPATLIESELFGRERGAYTGALAREIGRFELAHESTLFLDEVGEIPPEVQSKLLRVLQEGQLERLGSPKTMQVNVRVVAATGRNLQAMVKEGKFREDLYYRLNVFPIYVPPLRERKDDIPELVWHILKELSGRMGRNVTGVQAKTMLQFQKYSWPGNIRELRNVIERNLILNDDSIFHAEILDGERSSHHSMQRLDEVDAEHLSSVLKATRGRIRGKGGAAELLGLKPTTMESKMKKLGIHRPS